MRVPPHFTSDERFLIIQLGDFTYLVDVPNWKIHLRIGGFPIGISKDESLLLIGQVNSFGKAVASVYELENAKEFPLNAVSADAFEPHQRLYCLKSSSKNVIFQDSFVDDNTQKFELGIGCVKSQQPLFKILASPIVAINGRCVSDWGGFDFAWIGNLDIGEIVYTHTLMEDAPMSVNYTPLSKRLILIAGDGVHIIEPSQKIRLNQAQRVFAARPFNTHSMWSGEAEKVDAVAHPSDSNRVIVAWRKNWHEVYLSGDEAGIRIEDKAKTLDTEIIMMAYHPDGQRLTVLTKQDIRLYEIASCKLLEMTPIF